MSKKKKIEKNGKGRMTQEKLEAMIKQWGKKTTKQFATQFGVTEGTVIAYAKVIHFKNSKYCEIKIDKKRMKPKSIKVIDETLKSIK